MIARPSTWRRAAQPEQGGNVAFRRALAPHMVETWKDSAQLAEVFRFID